jgi:hypothetical protein
MDHHDPFYISTIQRILYKSGLMRNKLIRVVAVFFLWGKCSIRVVLFFLLELRVVVRLLQGLLIHFNNDFKKHDSIFECKIKKKG